MQKPYHIIIADDDDDDQFIIREALRQLAEAQVDVTSVYDGLQLIDCLYKKGLFAEFAGNADLIILDINMPLMNGIETLGKIKGMRQFRDIPVVILSTVRNAEAFDKTAQRGALKFFTKPNTINGYCDILREVLNDILLSDKRIPA